jgi:DnaJ-class molecular chaperone
MRKTCPECLGSGLDQDRKACGRCGGLGDVYELRRAKGLVSVYDG